MIYRRHIVFSLSVCLYSKTFTLAIAFEWEVIELSFFTYSITCIQRPPKGSKKSGLLQQLVCRCRFHSVDLRRAVVLEWWSLKAVSSLIQVVSNTGFIVCIPWGKILSLVPKSLGQISRSVFEKMAVVGIHVSQTHFFFFISEKNSLSMLWWILFYPRCYVHIKGR